MMKKIREWLFRRFFQDTVSDIEHKAYFESYDAALLDVIKILRNKDRIYLEPVTLRSDEANVHDCVFLGIHGNGLTIEPKE